MVMAVRADRALPLLLGESISNVGRVSFLDGNRGKIDFVGMKIEPESCAILPQFNH